MTHAILEESPYLVFADFNCPYCYSLNERLLTLGDTGRTDWRSIEHLPDASSAQGSLEVQMFLSTEVGIVRRRAPEVQIRTPAFLPSTNLANRLVVALSRSLSPADRWTVRTAIYRAYWRDGLDISNLDVLHALLRRLGFALPTESLDEEWITRILAGWQAQWSGERFAARLPALLSRRDDRPLLGFPALDVLFRFFTDPSLPHGPESLAACECASRQRIIVVGTDPRRPNTAELESPYVVSRLPHLEDAAGLLAGAPDRGELVVIDLITQGPTLEEAEEAVVRFLTDLRKVPALRSMAVLVLSPSVEPGRELRMFDAGATDILFDLSNPKVTQARLEIHMRLRRSTALLRSMATFDYLTELVNRREFDRRIEAEWTRARRSSASIAVLMIDVDHFKKYNDAYGHDAGDDCLRMVARAIQEQFRRGGDLPARYRGEEFVVLLPETDLAGAKGQAEAVLAAVRALGIRHEGNPGGIVTISGGYAVVVPGDQDTPAALIRAADSALYEAKSTGRDRAVGAP